MSHETLPQEALDPERLGRFETAFADLIDLNVEPPETEITCFGCGGPTDIKLVPYDYISDNNPLVKLVEKMLPGYACPDDETVYLAVKADQEFKTAVATGLSNLGDTSLRNALDYTPSKSSFSELPIFPNSTS